MKIFLGLLAVLLVILLLAASYARIIEQRSTSSFLLERYLWLSGKKNRYPDDSNPAFGTFLAEKARKIKKSCLTLAAS